jgi:TonB family protein
MTRSSVRTHPGRRPAGVIAALAILIALPVLAVDPISLDSALAKHRQEKYEAAAAEFLALAERDDARAQYMLALAYLKGQGVPRDLTRGYGWLLVAAEPYPGQYGELATEEARRTVKEIEPKLPGSDLIHGEQFATAFREKQAKRLEAAQLRAIKAILAVADGAKPSAAEQAAHGGPYPGCGFDATLSECPPLSSVPLDNCKGPALLPDPKIVTAGPQQPKPTLDYPVTARKNAWDGSVPVMMQIGRDGRICQVMLVMSSGVPALDEAALKSVKRWQLNRATLDGAPVSLIDSTSVTFQLSDYVVK